MTLRHYCVKLLPGFQMFNTQLIDSFQGTLGEGSQEKSMTTAQFNKLMKLFPQPDLGQAPYRQMKRLPTQSYADDIFHRKTWQGKAS